MLITRLIKFKITGKFQQRRATSFHSRAKWAGAQVGGSISLSIGLDKINGQFQDDVACIGNEILVSVTGKGVSTEQT
jgi:hypothetical protein